MDNRNRTTTTVLKGVIRGFRFIKTGTILKPLTEININIDLNAKDRTGTMDEITFYVDGTARICLEAKRDGTLITTPFVFECADQSCINVALSDEEEGDN